MKGLPDISNETSAVQDWLTYEGSSEDLAKKYSMASGHGFGAKARKERKVEVPKVETKEDLLAMIELTNGLITLSHWLVLSPAKTGKLIQSILAPDDLLKELYVDKGMSNKEITDYIDSPYISYEKVRDRVKRLKLRHIGDDKENIRLRAVKEYNNNAKKVAKRNETYRKNMLEKYGVDTLSPFGIEEFYKKGADSVISKYGSFGASSPIIKERIKNTMIARYGVTNNKLSKELIAKHIDWHETKYVHSAVEALELIESGKDKVPTKLLAFLQDLANKGEFETITPNQVCVDILGLNTGYLSSGRVSELHPDGKLITADYRQTQLEVVDYLLSLGIDKADIQFDKYPKFMKGKQLDIYLPKYNFAIEYNGSYWHANKGLGITKAKDKDYHANKVTNARKAGVNLMHIWDYDWINKNKQPIVKSQIIYYLNKIDKDNRLFARKLTVKKVPNMDKKLFLLKNNIQGDIASSDNYGLYQDNELVAVMTFGNRRFDNKKGYELLRFANKINYSIAGGASKLLKAFRNEHKGEILISYANNDFAYSGDKSLYNNLGFTFIRKTAPGYKWVSRESKEVVSNYKSQVKSLKEYTAGKGTKTFKNEEPDFSNMDTEDTYMVRHKYYKVYDAGNDLYELNM